jgi:thioredoxin reductase
VTEEPWDVIVVGGGPAGLSAAYWLARYRRRTLILDDGRPRNDEAWAVHGFPGLSDPSPQELRRILRSQATDAGALVEQRRAASIDGAKGAFVLTDTDGATLEARRIVLAYGRTDRRPDVSGLDDLYGTSVFHCPDCDGPSVAGCVVGVLGHDRPAAWLALYLLTWAERTVLLTDGREPELDEDVLDTLDRHGVSIEGGRVEHLEGEAGRLIAVRLEGGTVDLGALFFHWGSDPSSELGPMAGCACSPSGHLDVDPSSLESSVAGIHAAGDIIGHPHLAISAAAEGVRAALAIHRSLLPDEIQL